MQLYKPSPNLLLVGAPKCGTTSLMVWLREHPEIYHPWGRLHKNAAESGFLLAGIIDLPYHPSFSKGDLLLPNETNMSHYNDEKWILDKSTQHLYSKKARSIVSELMPDCKVIITIRDPYDLLVSYHSMILNKTLYYDTSLEELVVKLDDLDWVADDTDPKTWSFISYPKYSQYVKSWIQELGEDRVRVVPLPALAEDPKRVLEQLSSWLNIDAAGIPKNLNIQNTSGVFSDSKVSKFLRNPPSWAFKISHILMPSRQLRKLILDPIRRRGWKHIKTNKKLIPQQIEQHIREQLKEEISFFENLADHIPENTIIY
ncbi:sulfotransferase [Euryarchaeota archaeon]|nr:sulfotransferase [Euryarchaeota archaeon]